MPPKNSAHPPTWRLERRRRRRRQNSPWLLLLAVAWTTTTTSHTSSSLFDGSCVVGAAATTEESSTTSTSSERHENVLEQMWHKMQRAVQEQTKLLQRSSSSSRKKRKDSSQQRQKTKGQNKQSSTSSSSTSSTASTAYSMEHMGVAIQRRRRALFLTSLRQQQVQQQVHSNATGARLQYYVDEYARMDNHGSPPPQQKQKQQSSQSSQSSHPYEPPRLDRTTLLHDGAFPPFPPSRAAHNRNLLQSMFQHGYDAYLQHGWPLGQVHPLTCTPDEFSLIRLPALTVLDALDTLLVLGNVTEFARAVERVRQLHYETAVVVVPAAATQHHGPHPHHDTREPPHPIFDGGLFGVDENVSVFETNIRVLGGLLSAHQLARAHGLHMADTAAVPNRHVWRSKQSTEDDDDGPHYQDTSSSSSSSQWWDAHPDGEILWGPVPDATEASAMDGTKDDGNDNDASCTVDRRDDGPTTQPTAPTNTRSVLTNDGTLCGGRDPLSLHQCTMEAIKLAQDQSKKNFTAPQHTYYWRYDGFLLDLAMDIGARLLPAFASVTGIPYGTVNLLHGVPPGETPVASLAGGGTLSLEFELLSRLSGDDRFGQAAKLAARALYMHRSSINLLGKHIDTRNGKWQETLSGIGSNSDSYLEYLAKHAVLFPEDDDFWHMFTTAYQGVTDDSRLGEWYADVDMHHGTGPTSTNGRRVFESLAAFFPGLQVLLGQVGPAARSLNSFLTVREVLGFLPERFHFGIWNLDGTRSGAGKHPLRPELLESNYWMHRATGRMRSPQSDDDDDDDATELAALYSGWQWAADFSLHKLEQTTKAKCGYASLLDVQPSTTGGVHGIPPTKGSVLFMDEMPSFFLSETLKYLYLTFDDDNVLHRDDDRQWVFTTEAHPIHHEPKVTLETNRASDNVNGETGEANEFEWDMRVLQTMLTEPDTARWRIQRRDRRHIPGTDLGHERWSDVTSYRAFRQEMTPVSPAYAQNNATEVDESMDGYTNRLDDDLLGVYIPVERSLDSFGERAEKSNLAHLSYSNRGSGATLRRSCPNMHDSALLWMQAVNGGSTDYSDNYISVMTDTVSEHPFHSSTLLGAADALGVIGTGVYFGERDQQAMRCSLNEHVPLTQKASTEGTEKVKDVSDGVIQVQSDIGNFEVSTYADGNGFRIRLLDSGEEIKTNIVSDDTDDTVVMVYTELRSTKTPKSALDFERASYESDLVRKVSVADFNENAFSCDVELLVRGSVVDDDVGLGTSYEESIALIPCSPALFGPSEMSALLTQGGIKLEANLKGPIADNNYGCVDEDLAGPAAKKLLDGAQVDANREAGSSFGDNSVKIDVVHRGECPFLQKSLNMRKSRNTDGLIVVNDSSDDFFMMSAGLQERRNADEDEIPLTVLVAEQDGALLLETLNIMSEPNVAVIARISLERRFGGLNAEGKVVNEDGLSSPDLIHWPVVRADRTSLEILAEYEWGIRADFNGEISEKNKREWRLNLLRHDNPDVAD